LQLSIRCSSIHFLPSRSFPLSELIVFGAVLESPSTGTRSSAKPCDALRIANAKARAGPNGSFTAGHLLPILLQREII
jgi:hypothetical protein